MKKRIAVLLLGLMLAPFALAGRRPAPRSYFVYVGTYTGQKSKGIYAYRFDPASGNLDSIGLAGEIASPSWLTVHPNRKFLYAVTEVGSGGGRAIGSITSFAIEPKTGALTQLNTVSAGGGGPCHLVVDKTGKALAVANYGSGSVAAFPVQDDGRLGEASIVIKHSGSSTDPKRQSGPHAHAVVLSADNRFLFVPDLGLDQVMIYRLDPAKAALTANDPPFGKVRPGAGPRHFAFHPNHKYAYAINEMGSAVTAFGYDAARGALKELQMISTLPKDFSGVDNSAEVEVDAKGRRLYASNRGHDSIAVFTIARNGKLTPVEYVSTKGKTPRNFKIDPTGSYLFAANQNSDNIVLFRIDPKSGRLTATGKTIEVPAPVCVQFVPVEL